jgi:anti-sigma regulatory factor (Ser/Thr protein kinase)
MAAIGEASFTPVPESVPEARHFAINRLEQLGCPGATVETAALLVSELASNAVRHAATPFHVLVGRSEHTVEVAVCDSGAGVPAVRDPDATGGRGLTIVEAFARDWGVHRQRGGKAVYFHLPC